MTNDKRAPLLRLAYEKERTNSTIDADKARAYLADALQPLHVGMETADSNHLLSDTNLGVVLFAVVRLWAAETKQRGRSFEELLAEFIQGAGVE
jgi:hypothetical protein